MALSPTCPSRKAVTDSSTFCVRAEAPTGLLAFLAHPSRSGCASPLPSWPAFTAGVPAHSQLHTGGLTARCLLRTADHSFSVSDVLRGHVVVLGWGPSQDLTCTYPNWRALSPCGPTPVRGSQEPFGVYLFPVSAPLVDMLPDYAHLRGTSSRAHFRICFPSRLPLFPVLYFGAPSENSYLSSLEFSPIPDVVCLPCLSCLCRHHRHRSHICSLGSLPKINCP